MVCDKNNQRIQVFELNGKFLGNFGFRRHQFRRIARGLQLLLEMAELLYWIVVTIAIKYLNKS